MTPCKIIVTGSTGLLGKYILKNIIINFENCVIYILRRDFSIYQVTKENNLIKINTLNFGSNCFLINCAGEYVNKINMYSANVDFPLKLIEFCLKNGINNFIHMSSVGSFGAGRYQGEVNEDTQYLSPKNLYEKTKAEADALLDKKRGASIRIVTIMPSNVVFSSERSSRALLNFYRLFDKFLPQSKGASGWLNFIDVDAVSACISGVIKGEINHKKIILNNPLSYEECVNITKSVTKKKANIKEFPYLFLKLIYWAFSLLKKIGVKKSDLILRRVYEMDNNLYFKTKFKDIQSISNKYGFKYIMSNVHRFNK